MEKHTTKEVNNNKIKLYYDKTFIKYGQKFIIKYPISSFGKGHYCEALETGKKVLKGDAIWLNWNEIKKRINDSKED